MEEFNFPFHEVSIRYPERSASVRLGGGWNYTTTPRTPISRIFTLHFATMKFFENESTLTSLQEQISAGHLEDFYARHELHKDFLYQHYRHGSLIVRFQKPLEVPKPFVQGDGAIRAFQIVLIEQPYS